MLSGLVYKDRPSFTFRDIGSKVGMLKSDENPGAPHNYRFLYRFNILGQCIK